MQNLATSEYLILPFQCIEPHKGKYFVASRLGLIRIETQAIFAMAGQMRKGNWGRVLTQFEIEKMVIAHGLQRPDLIIGFLMEIGALRKVTHGHGNFLAIRLICDASVDPEKFARDITYFTNIPVQSERCADGLSDDELAVIYTPTCDHTLILEVERKARHLKNVAVLSSFLVARYFVINSLYVPLAQTPCHFCQISASNLGQKKVDANLPSWMGALNFVVGKPALSGLEYEIRPSDHALCLVILRNKIRELLGPNLAPIRKRALMEACQFSLDGFEIERSIPFANIECEYCD